LSQYNLPVAHCVVGGRGLAEILRATAMGMNEANINSKPKQ